MKDIEILIKKPFAHRGYFNKEDGIPENSIPAFERAVKSGFGIELDVHILKDGAIVVFHDDSLNRMTGVNKNLKDLTYDEIKDLKLNGTSFGIPLFIDVLKIVDGKVPILIELKYDNKVRAFRKGINGNFKRLQRKIRSPEF